MNAQKRNQLFEILAKDNPTPTTELEFKSPFELLIAVILSAQATDKSVNKATKLLFPIADSPKAIRDLGVEGLSKYIQTINLYRTKAKHIVETCEILIKQHKSHVPHTREALEALPGVGRKTANVVLNTAFGQETLAVDTHIFRVANRTHLALGKKPLEVEHQLLKTVPKKYLKDAHHWLILLGRYTCVARKPKCPICPIREYCEYEQKTQS